MSRHATEAETAKITTAHNMMIQIFIILGLDYLQGAAVCEFTLGYSLALQQRPATLSPESLNNIMQGWMVGAEQEPIMQVNPEERH